MSCEICGSDSWRVVYSGPVRDGSWPKSAPGVVRECAGCGVRRLDDPYPPEHFQTAAYFQSLGEGDHAGGYSSRPDMDRPDVASMWRPWCTDGRVVDVGSGPGAFLEAALQNGARAVLGVEPSRQDGGPRSVKDALAIWPERADLVTILNTVEYVANPVEFLSECRGLLAHTGRILLTTANANDSFLDRSPAYPAFFYRKAVKWYFTMGAMLRCAARAGLVVDRIKFAQRYPLSNGLAWEKDGRPTGMTEPADETYQSVARAWREGVEHAGVSDRYYLLLRWLPAA